MAKTKTCEFCGQEGLVWTEASVGWRLMDPKTEKIHDCRQVEFKEYPKKKEEPLRREVSPPGQDRLVSSPAAGKTKVKKMWIRYGETLETGNRTRDYGITVEAEIGPEDTIDVADSVRLAIQHKIQGWQKEDQSKEDTK